MSMEIAYSKICDTVPAAYYAYLAAVTASHGKNTDPVDAYYRLLGSYRGRDVGADCSAIERGLSCGATVQCGVGGSGFAVADGIEDVGTKRECLHHFGRCVEAVRCGGFVDSVVGAVAADVEACAGTTQSSVGIVGSDPIGGTGGVESEVAADCHVRPEAGVDVAPSGLSSVSSKTLANRDKRHKAKLRKQRKQAEAKQSKGSQGVVSESVPEWRRKAKVDVGVTPARYVAGLINADSDAELKESVKAKWIAKNKLEAAKAEREFAVLQGVDVDVAVRKQNVVMRSAIERGLVTIEKSHASLRGADVHSSDDETRVHTMLSGTSGSISPNSSVSEAELRAMIARDAELERKNAELEKRVNDLIAQMTKGGVEVKEQVPAPKSMWTVDDHGELLQEHQDAFFDSGYCFTTGDTVPQKCADGKMRTYVNYF